MLTGPETDAIYFRKYQAKGIKKVHTFLKKYYNPSSCGDSFADVLKWHIAHVEKHGYTILGRKESKTGEPISFYK